MPGKSDTPRDQDKGAGTTRSGKPGPTDHSAKGAGSGERRTAPGRSDSSRTGGQTERERLEQGAPRETRGAAAGGTEDTELDPNPGAGDEDEDLDADDDETDEKEKEEE